MPSASNVQQLNSEELAVQVQAGSAECFTELVRRYRRPLLGFLRKRLPSDEDAEDVAQETFSRAHRAIDRYKTTHSFKTWLFTIATRLAYSHHRKRVQSFPLEGEELLVATEAGPDEVVGRRDRAGNLWHRVSVILPRKQTRALWLRYGDGMTVKEIAGHTGWSQVYVKVLLHRARLRLAEKLQDEEL
jgi:RNA polymerase sigma-70 factor (ECF subfamily)